MKQRVKLLLHVANLGTQISKHGNTPKVKNLPGWEEWYFQSSERQYRSEAAAYEYLQVFQVHNAMALARFNSQTAPFLPMLFPSCWMPNHSHLLTQRSFPCRSLQPLLDAVDSFRAFGGCPYGSQPREHLFSPSLLDISPPMQQSSTVVKPVSVKRRMNLSGPIVWMSVLILFG